MISRFLMLTLVLLSCSSASWAQRSPNVADYRQAERFGSSRLQPFVYGSRVTPSWIGDSNRFWYSFRNSEGTRYWLVDAEARTRVPLFDHDELAARVSELSGDALSATNLRLSGLSVDDKAETLSFDHGEGRYRYRRAGGELEKTGKARRRGGRGRGSREAAMRDRLRGSMNRRAGSGRSNTSSYSPDGELMVMVKGHDIFIVGSEAAPVEAKAAPPKDGESTAATKSEGEAKKSEGEAKKSEGEAKKTEAKTSKTEKGSTKTETKSSKKTETKKDPELPSSEPQEKTSAAKGKQEKTSAGKGKGKQERTSAGKGKQEKTSAGKGKQEKTSAGKGKQEKTSAGKGKQEKTSAGKGKQEKTSAGKGKQEKTSAGKGKQEKTSAGKGKQEKTSAGKGKQEKTSAGKGKQEKTAATKEETAAAKAKAEEAKNFKVRKGRRFDLRTAKSLRKGEEKFSFSSSLRPGRRSGLSWSPDSKAFFVRRTDSRGVEDLFLVDSIAQPRPKLQTYTYPMPGEDKIRRSELSVFSRETGTMVTLPPKWKDESYLDTRWWEGKLRVLRRDRTMRQLEYCELDPHTNEVKVLFSEKSKRGSIETQSIRYLEERKEMVWWSQRSGWGHFYLYGTDGKLKNAITRGSWRASSIVDLDEKAGMLYFRANAREKNENPYYTHTYRVRLDGSGLTLLDPGNASHSSSLSKSKRYLVDNSSRIDEAPRAVLRDDNGNELMQLETMDWSRLQEMGWKAPETFVVKAADGTTDLYGNLWKPFDFDPSRSYPIIAHVYPGPQQEGVSHGFRATNGNQELAQLGFIVIQVGHRGGSPQRDRAYATYGYYNLRDYGLADKKTAIEQLSARHSWIDIERIGIYGHSGGGFMSAAALLRKPYNRFFKAAVASAGNHDNNIYNNTWSERYHGLKEVEVKATKDSKATKSGAGAKPQEKVKGGQEKVLSTEKGDAKTKGKQEKTVSDSGKTKTEEGKKKTEEGKKKTEEGKKKTEEGKKKTEEGKKKGETAKKEEKKTKLEIAVPTNAELAANLEGALLLVHGEIDNNVHPANTMRLVDALIKANKRFDMLLIPGARHSFGAARTYFKHRMWEHFAENLLGDRQLGADIVDKARYRD